MIPDLDDATAWTTWAEPFLPPVDSEGDGLDAAEALALHRDLDEGVLAYDPTWDDCAGLDAEPGR